MKASPPKDRITSYFSSTDERALSIALISEISPKVPETPKKVFSVFLYGSRIFFNNFCGLPKCDLLSQIQY